MANTYYDTIIATSGLVGYWRLGETSGNMLPSSGSVQGTVFNTPTRGVAGATVDDVNLAVTLNGSTQYIDFGNNYPNSGSYSVECWVKFTSVAASSGFQTFISKEDYGTSPYSGWGMYLEEATNTISFARMDTTSQKKMTAGTFSSGVWYHIVATYDGSNMRLYSNGSQIGTAVATAVAAKTSTAPMRIGQAGTGGDFFGGTIDEVALYNVALSGATILNHYQMASITASFLSKADSGTITSTDTNAGISATISRPDGGTIADTENNVGTKISTTRTDTRTITSIEAKSVLGLMTRTDTGIVTSTEAKTLNSFLTRSDSGLVSHTILKDIVTGNPPLLNAENEDDIRKRANAIDKVVRKFVPPPYSIMYDHVGVFADTPISYDDFLVVDAIGQPRLVGQATTNWNLGTVTVTTSYNVGSRPDLLEKYGIIFSNVG